MQSQKPWALWSLYNAVAFPAFQAVKNVLCLAKQTSMRGTLALCEVSSIAFTLCKMSSIAFTLRWQVLGIQTFFTTLSLELRYLHHWQQHA